MVDNNKEIPTEITGSSFNIQKRKQVKQFTVNSSKKTTRIPSYNNLKNQARLIRIRSVDSINSNISVGGNDSDNSIVIRTKSNNIYSRPIKAKSTTNLLLKKNRKNRFNMTDTDSDVQSLNNDSDPNINKDDDINDEINTTHEDFVEVTDKTLDNLDVVKETEKLNDNKDDNNKPTTKYINDNINNQINNDLTPVNAITTITDTTTTIHDNEKKDNTAIIDTVDNNLVSGHKQNNDNLNQTNSNTNDLETQRSQTHQIDNLNQDLTDMKLNNLKQLNNKPLEEPISNIKQNQDQSRNDIQEVNNSLNMYRMHSLLSQSTGQERQLSNSKIPMDLQQSQTKEQQLPETNNTEPQPNKEKNDAPSSNSSNRNDSNTSIATSKSSSLYQGNQDSLIFQQSGLTLYNMNTQLSLKNLQLTQTANANMKRTVSQQSLQRQESYLSFRVPDNHQNQTNFATLNGNLTQQKATNRLEAPQHLQKSNLNLTDSTSKIIIPKKDQDDKNVAQQVSQLSKQAKTLETLNDNAQAEILNLDLSSYLSTQEPEIESRTQQKLWLQRENVATLNDFEEGSNQTPSQIINQTTRFQYEQLSREFLHIRRHTNPMLESLQRNHKPPEQKGNNKSKKLDVPDAPKTISKSISKSTLKNSKPVNTSSISQSLGLSLNNSELPPEVFSEDLETYNDALSSLWNKSCISFKDSNPPVNMQNSNIVQNGPALSARYGYQPSSGMQQFPQAFMRGNHTSFGNTNVNNGLFSNYNNNTGGHNSSNDHNINDSNINHNFGNQTNHFNGMNRSSQYQPTTRAQQQQQQEQQRRYQLQQQRQQNN